MNALELTMNKPIKSLTVKDLQRLYKAHYIVVSELNDLHDRDHTIDIAAFFLQFPNKYDIETLEMELITWSYGACYMENELDAISQCRTLIIKGLKRFANFATKPENATINEIITRLERNYE